MKRHALTFHPWCCLKTAVLVALVATKQAHAQSGPDSLSRFQRVYQRVVDVQARASDWPGFRPDTLPFLFVVPGWGHVLVNWAGVLPGQFRAVTGLPRVGFRPLDALASASTSVQLDGRNVAQVSVSRFDEVELAGLAAHEAFHAYAGNARRPSSYLGQGENTFLVSSYPVFDSINDGQFALEGRLLAAALSAATTEEARARSREFVAVRAARQRRLGPELAQFEVMTENNEGLAQYLQETTQNRLRGRNQSPVSEELLNGLRNLATTSASLRLRYYYTGSAQALLLDRLAGPAWKQRYLAERVLLQDVIGDVSGAFAEQERMRSGAEMREAYSRLLGEAAGNLQRLKSARRARADSILAAPGLQVVLSSEQLQRSFSWCGIDPQNLLQASETVILHTRWVVACAGTDVRAEFNTPVVQDRASGELRAVIPADVRITAAGQEVRLRPGQSSELTTVAIEAGTFSARFARAVLRLEGNALRIWPRLTAGRPGDSM